MQYIKGYSRYHSHQIGRGNTFQSTVLLFLVVLSSLSTYDYFGGRLAVGYIDHTLYNTSKDVRVRALATHRGNRFVIQYNQTDPRFYFSSQAFEGGVRTDANFAADFEDIRPGSFGWTVDASRVDTKRIRGSHYNTFDFPLSGDLTSSTTVSTHSSGQSATYSQTVYSNITFYTGPHAPTVYVDGKIYALGTHADRGDLGIGDVNVAVFNFRFIDLAANVTVTADGDRPLVILSRTSIFWHCMLKVKPGTLGGWKGWGKSSGATGIGVNERGGEGAGARAVYSHTLTVSGTNIDEIQTWTTTVEPEENLGGFYTISCKGETSRPIQYNASPRLVKQIIESDMPRLGEVTVSRTFMPDDGGGFTWNITFSSAISDVPQVAVDGKLLTGMNSKIVSGTVRQANAVGGDFTLSFLGATTRAIAFDASADNIRTALEEDIPNIVTAFVSRTDKTAAYNEKGEALDSDHSTVHDSLCEDGSCPDGAGPAGGLVWTIQTSTRVGVIMPREPTARTALFPEWSEPVMTMTANATGLSGEGVKAVVVAGHALTDTRIGSLSHGIYNNENHTLNSSLPFTIAFGGSGGSSGGQGGGSSAAFQLENTDIARSFIGPNYNDESITSLRGGSSGAIGGQLPLSRFLRHSDIAGSGGSGGGVVEIVAHNDFTILSTGGIKADGEAGEDGSSGGGGGSGGTIVLVAGGAFRQEGRIGANGGAGGHCLNPDWRGYAQAEIPGSGGGGGRIAVYANSIYEDPTSSKYNVNGGDAGHCSSNNRSMADTQLGLSLSSSGLAGTSFVSSLSNISWYVDHFHGALGTKRSLALVGGESARTVSGIVKLTPYLTGVQVEIQQNDGNYATTGDSATNGYNENWNGNRRGLGSTGDLCAMNVMPPVDSGLATYCNQPRRVTVYLRFEGTNEGSVQNAQGGQFAIHPAGGRDGYGGKGPIGRGEGAHIDARQGGNILIGVAAVNGNLYHSANYDDIEQSIKQRSENISSLNASYYANNSNTSSSENNYQNLDPDRLLVLEAYEFKRWYKIDVFISWKNSTYTIRVDDVRLINNAPFRGRSVDRLGLYTYHNTKMYADEIFAGDEQTINFKCPVSLIGGQDGYRPTGVSIRRPWEKSWDPVSLGPQNESFHEKVRHTDSFFALLPRFSKENGYGGLIPNDGPGNTEFISGVTQRFEDGDYESKMGTVEISVFMYDPRAVPSFPEDTEITSRTIADKQKKGYSSGEHGCLRGSNCEGLTGETGRYYWYGEHHDSEDGRNFLRGAVVACSTTDFINWRNEGTMLHFSNLTDDHHGTGTFHENGTDLIVERPKVIYNKKTEQYVMWMHLDDRNNSLRLAAVAVSDYPNGPFTFVRSFRPDKNETQDMTVMQVRGEAVLARTYFATTEFVLASPVMQPLWESVKRPNGVPVPEYEGGYLEKRNFGLNYHRAFYHESYDDNDDICYQRLRAEDRPFSYKKADDECSRQSPQTIKWIDHETENDLRRNFDYRASGNVNGIDLNGFLNIFRDLGLQKLNTKDSDAQNRVRMGNLLSKYDKNEDGRLKWEDTSNNDDDEFILWYQDAVGNGLSTMDPPLLTYFPENKDEIYYPEDIYIPNAFGVEELYRGGSYLDCHNRIEVFDGVQVFCGDGNDGLEHPKVDPSNDDAEAYFGTSKNAAGNNIPTCQEGTAYYEVQWKSSSGISSESLCSALMQSCADAGSGVESVVTREDALEWHWHCAMDATTWCSTSPPPAATSFLGSQRECQRPHLTLDTPEKKDAWCTPHERRKWSIEHTLSTGSGNLYGLQGLTPACGCKLDGSCPDIDPAAGITDFNPNLLKYSDYVGVMLGFAITAEGQVVNDDQPARPKRPGERFSHCCDMLQNQTGSVHPTLFYTTSSKDDTCLSGNDGSGFPTPLRSRFKYAGLTHVHDFWKPNSVPNLRGHIQPWSQNYMDGNIADNALHGTEPDQLIAPSKVVFTRRAKYVVITRLSENYLETTNYNNIFEGEAIDRSLNSILDDFGQFGWDSGNVSGGTTEHHQIWATDIDQKKATSRNRSFPEVLELQRYIDAGAPVDDKPLFDAEEPDWLDRFWQFDEQYGDRRSSPVNFVDQINGRRQWDGRNGSNTLRARVERTPLDRNCIYEGEIPPVWTNQLGLVPSLYKIQGTWGLPSAGGGSKGSSNQYNYDDDEISSFQSTSTSNDPLLINGIGFVGKMRSWGRRAGDRLTEDPQNSFGTEVGTTAIFDMENYLSGYRKDDPEIGYELESSGDVVSKYSKRILRTFSSKINPGCATYDGIAKIQAGLRPTDTGSKDKRLTTNQWAWDGTTMRYQQQPCYPSAGKVLPSFCHDLICSKEKAFDDDYYVEHPYLEDWTALPSPDEPVFGEDREAQLKLLLEKRGTEGQGFNGFYSAPNETNYGAWLGVELKQMTKSPIVKIYSTWTKETLDKFFARDPGPLQVNIPPQSVGVYISATPAHLEDGFPLKWFAERRPCATITALTPYPDHDGGSTPVMCVGEGKFLYIVNNTASRHGSGTEADPFLDGNYYLMVAQMDVVGTVRFDRPSISHPPKVQPHVCAAEGFEPNTPEVACVSTCPVRQFCDVGSSIGSSTTSGVCRNVALEITRDEEGNILTCPGPGLVGKPDGIAAGGCEENERCIENPRHHGSLGSGPWRYSVGQEGIEYPDSARGFEGFRAPGWDGVECSSRITMQDAPSQALSKCEMLPECEDFVLGTPKLATPVLSLTKTPDTWTYSYGTLNITTGATESFNCSAPAREVTVCIYRNNKCLVNQMYPLNVVWGKDSEGYNGTEQKIYYFQDYHDDDEQKLDPRWTYEKAKDPRFAQYYESGDFSYYTSEAQALADRPPSRL